MATSPGLTAAITATLAVAVAAAAAVLTLLNGVVLKPLPVERPRELVLFSDDPRDGVFTGTQEGTWIVFSTPSFDYLRARQRAFQDVAAFQAGRDRLAVRVDGAAQELAYRTHVSGNYFAVMGVGAQAGRTLAVADDRPGAPPVAVLSDAFWNRRFARDPAVVGRTITLGSTPHTIVGVAPRGFYGETLRTPPDLWTPLVDASGRSGAGYDEHHTYWLGLVGRLKPGVAIGQANTQVNALLTAFLEDEAGPQLTAERRAAIARTNIALTRGDLGRSAVRGRAATPLALLATLVVLLLTAAAVNVASLLLARAAARERVIAVHRMLGASRGRLLRSAVADTAAFVAPGAAAGLALAFVKPALLLPLVATTALPIDLGPDARLIAMLAAALAVAFGLACAGPVWFVLAADRTPFRSAPSHAAGRALVGAQIALAVPLLVVAGLLLRSVERLEGQDLPVVRDRVLLVDLAPSSVNRAAAIGAMLDALRAQPGVAAATAASQTPLGGDTHGSSLRVEGRPPREDRAAEGAFVGPGYFHALGIPLVAGRDLTAADDEAHPRVVVLSETAARTFLPGENALGRRVAYGSRPPAEVVGIARDVKMGSLRAAPPREVFVPQLQNGGYGGRLVVRTDGDPVGAAAAVRATIQRAAPQIPITRMVTLDAEIAAATATERALALAAATLAGATLLVAATGLCGLLAYIVARHTREVGIRMALGASGARIVHGVVADALRIAAIGALAGVALAGVAARAAGSLLFDVKPGDPVVMSAAALAVMAAALAASVWPARRASRVDPIVALKTD